MLRRPLKTIKLIVDKSVENEDLGKKVDEVTVGSVTVPIFFSPTRIKVPKPTSDPANPGNAEIRVYQPQ